MLRNKGDLMPEFTYTESETWNTAIRLAASIGRLKIGSNLKASGDSHAHAFEEAGVVAGLIAEATTREGIASVALYREARGALARCRSWLFVLARVTNEAESVFALELDLVDQASRQINGSIRALERGSSARPVDRGPARPPQGTRGGNIIPGPRGGQR
ncbi:MAG: hypothetical protein WEC33_08190 [Dehalococcoidia bacterium]